jgi:hypothetical protein
LVTQPMLASGRGHGGSVCNQPKHTLYFFVLNRRDAARISTWPS